ncbi:beta-propeller fold lactonase family protein [Leptospira vanthielii]|uniref:Bacterial Ig-like domain, group 2 n=1 Tax=Leptospira vanthielii serovar Holland str. Waz Holland = ATCC 700522 TaxID=1218591 RepID=N1W533_9LEPT|nr:beta-propeller fold lactonase family protein [Leptospira vanthielii]EMY71369.1 bacterial Ig-like domain, group 2 [Leptospira vanthielii serovar Holland str. Waz Holland = ATCC 700522]
METLLLNQIRRTGFSQFLRSLYLIGCLFSFNACLLNPIVRDLLCPGKDPSSQSLFYLWALLANSNSMVELSQSWAGIYKGDSLQLKAQYYSYGSKTDSTFQWSSSNNSVATVDANGLVQSIGNGKVWITATAADGKAGASSDITVYTGYVYTSLDINHSVGHLTMDQSTGLLTFNSSVQVGTFTPTGIGVDPAGKFLFTGDFDGSSISQFLINQTTGALSLNTPATAPAGLSPRNLVITPDGKYLYLASEGTSAIRAYAINADGTLTFLVSYPTNIGSSQIQISRNGNFIFYMGTLVTEISSYRINYADGSLTQAGVSPTFSSDGSGHVSTHPNGAYIYVGSIPAVTVLSFDGETGNMSNMRSVNHAMSINSTAIHPSGLFYYLIHINEGIISCYAVEPKTGNITYSSNVTGYISSNLRFMIIDPTGRFAYVADINNSNLIQFSINQTTGALTFIGNVSPGGNPWNLIFL